MANRKTSRLKPAPIDSPQAKSPQAKSVEKSRPRFSVIVPCYNSSPHLPALFAQLEVLQQAEQTQLILVDDASRDATPVLLETARPQLQSRFAHVDILFSQVNTGSAEARNRGLAHAHGQFVQFIDVDDLFSPTLLSQAFDSLPEGVLPTDVDIVVNAVREVQIDKQGSDLQTVSPLALIIPEQPGLVRSSKKVDALAIQLEKQTLLGYVWNKLYRLDFLREAVISFPKAVYIEDFSFNLAAFSAAECVLVCERAPYDYNRSNTGSITRTSHSEYLAEHAHRVAMTLAFARERGLDTEETLCFLGDTLLRYTLGAYHKQGWPLRRWPGFLRYTFNLPLYRHLSAHMGHTNLKYAPFAWLLKHRCSLGFTLAAAGAGWVQTNLPALFDLLKRTTAPSASSHNPSASQIIRSIPDTSSVATAP